MGKNAEPDEPACVAITKSRQPCHGRPRASGYCFAHDPSLESTRGTARVKGGENSSRVARAAKLMPRRLRPVFDLLENAMRGVYEGDLDPRRATGMASLAGAMVKVLQAGELEELARELHELKES